ncbi:MAG: helicase [Neobacillus sp.]|nr:helicase [Neobacillus sp.]
MKSLVTEKKIKQLCGETAFKKGKAYYRAGKVSFEKYDEGSLIFKAVVKGDTLFHVTIKDEQSGTIKAECTCPTLASFNTYCQHVAAVLQCIHDIQEDGSSPFSIPSNNTITATEVRVENYYLANKILGLFGESAHRPSAKQLHFETREVLQVEFTCKPIPLKKGRYIFGVEARIGSINIENLREFLEKVDRREPYYLSKEFTYYPEKHSFQNEADAVIRKLMLIHQNEQMYLGIGKKSLSYHKRYILVSPYFWEDLFPLLSVAPFVTFQHEGFSVSGINLSKQPLPLSFEFNESGADDFKNFRLDVNGMSQLTIMQDYGYVLCEGKIIKLSEEECNRLAELKQLLDNSGEQSIIIPQEQIEPFVETVAPGLMKLGNVRIPQAISKQLTKTPLKAKLFLDRVKNRLLAGLEFHYGNMVINPLEVEKKLPSTSSNLVREGEKEQKILQMLEESSFTKTEGGYFMHNEEEEYHFLHHVVPRLKKLIQIYATTAVKIRVNTEYIGPKINVKVDERTDWLEFRFDLKTIPEAEIQDLLKSIEEKRKYYRMQNGSLVSLETDEFQKLLHFMNELNASSEDLMGQGIRVPLIQGIQQIDALEEGNLLSAEKTFKKLINNLQNPDNLEFAVPDSLDNILRDYQKFGFRWLKMLAKYKFGGILADDMGLGKTLQSIAFIVSVLSDIRMKKQPALIVCPSSLVYNWLNELKKFAPGIRVLIVDGSKVERNALMKETTDVDVIITSYPILRRDISSFFDKFFHTVFFDEAQAFKNHTTQTAKAVKKIQADYRFALTGTPVENSIEEIWSIFNVVFPNLLPGRSVFQDLRRENIAKRIRPFILRRLKEDVLKELPEKIEMIQTSDLHVEQKKLYAAYLAKLKQDTLKHLNKESFQKNRIRILAGLTRLRQICCHPSLFVEDYHGSSGKFEQLLEIIEECRSTGKRMLIFSQFTKMLGLIGREMVTQGLPYFYLDGQTPSSERVELCNRFNNGERDVFLISLKAGGTGLNLTGADTVVLYDLWWNPAVEQQAADRAHRMGQKNVVQVIKLVAHGTIEEKMNDLQERKKHLIEEVIQPGQDQLLTFTEQEIREILMM